MKFIKNKGKVSKGGKTIEKSGKTSLSKNSNEGKNVSNKNSFKNKKNQKSKGKWGKKDEEEDFDEVPTTDLMSNANTLQQQDDDDWNSDIDDLVMDSTTTTDIDTTTTMDLENDMADEDLKADLEDDFEAEQADAKTLLKSANRKGKKSGGFQSMGLSHVLFKAILHCGYKIPTPIQRKAIPVLLEGGDVVAMARTGSGKTAAFLIPMIEKLKAHSVKVGVRALILSPSRELATQTAKFTKDLTKYTDLRTSVFVGGDNMDNQFGEIASNPDIIIATPGRLMHLIIESRLEMKCVEYLVFDEADRLFEMGFAEQLREIVSRIPPSRQTVLFSATLPKILVDFARAGLVNPSLIRLDVDTKISRDLEMYFISLKKEEKDGALVYLLTQVIPKQQQTVVFVATKHHVEYINHLLLANGILSTHIYGTLDPTARKIHLARFRHGKAKVLVVTDVAARGLDVPLLDNVINYTFPPSSKTFVHRVGRTARAGKQGKAWSLVAGDELAYMLDLQLFTGRPLVYAHLATSSPNYTHQMILGTMPGLEVALQSESVHTLVKNDMALAALGNSVGLGYKMYIRSRPAASKSSHTRAKEISDHVFGIHPVFGAIQNDKVAAHDEYLSALSKFRPQESIFEVKSSKKGVKATAEAFLMQKRRSQFSEKIAKKARLVGQGARDEVERQKKILEREGMQEQGGDDDVIYDGFNDLTAGNKSKSKKSREIGESADFYLSYRPADDATEAGYAVHDASFNAHASKAAMELIPDDDEQLRKRRGAQTWDSKSHKFTSHQVGSDNKKRVRTENGTLVPATFQSDRFEKWQKKTKVDLPRAGEQELSNAAGMTQKTSRFRHNSITAPNLSSKSFQRKLDAQETLWRKQGLKGADLANAKNEWLSGKGVTKTTTRKGQSELKTVHQIAKERQQKEKRREKTGRHHVGGKKNSGKVKKR